MLTYSTPSTTKRRPLGYWESACKFAHDMLGGTGTVVSFVEFTGQIDRQQFRQALQLLFNRHPLLRATIKTIGYDSYFEINAEFDDIPVRFKEKQTIQQPWQVLFDERLNIQLDCSNFLWQLDIHSFANHGHYLFFCSHHAITDALSSVQFLHELFTTYHQLINKKFCKLTELSLLKNVEDCLKTTNSWDDYLHYQRDLPSISRESFHCFAKLGTRRSKNRYLTIPSKLLAQLQLLCKQNNVTLNSLLNSCLLNTVSMLKCNPCTSLRTPINLRPYCQPIISHEHIGCYISIVPTVHELKNSCLWQSANNYQHQLRQNIPKYGFLPAHMDLTHMDIEVLMQLFPIKAERKRTYFSEAFGISNLGVIHLENRYGDLKLNNFQFSTNRQVGDYQFFLSSATFNNQLNLALTYTEPLTDEGFIDEFMSEYALLIQNIACGTDTPVLLNHY